MKSQYLLLSLLIPTSAFAWGSVGHTIIADFAMRQLPKSAFTACGITANEIVEHVNDPDVKWRQQRMQHPHEAQSHYIHVDHQPKDWRTRHEAMDRQQGMLTYKITDWIELAKKQKAKGDLSSLKETLYGLSHYLGDLTQPLHAYSDHDGIRSGLTGIHSQFESKMVARYEEEIREQVARNMAVSKANPWAALDSKTLIFNVAEQSMQKAQPLLESSREAFEGPRKRKHGKQPLKPFFSKKKLWQATGSVAVEQITLGARLNAHVFGLICR